MTDSQTPMVRPVDLDALDVLEAKATPGDWGAPLPEYEQHSDTSHVGDWDCALVCTTHVSCEKDGRNRAHDNARFIAALRNAYPTMAAELRRLRGKE